MYVMYSILRASPHRPAQSFPATPVVTKENTALVIPNAIAISTFKKQYVFRSFWDRDHCFFMLKSFISKHSTKSSKSQNAALHAATNAAKKINASSESIGSNGTGGSSSADSLLQEGGGLTAAGRSFLEGSSSGGIGKRDSPSANRVRSKSSTEGSTGGTGDGDGYVILHVMT